MTLVASSMAGGFSELSATCLAQKFGSRRGIEKHRGGEWYKNVLCALLHEPWLGGGGRAHSAGPVSLRGLGSQSCPRSCSWRVPGLHTHEHLANLETQSKGLGSLQALPCHKLQDPVFSQSSRVAPVPAVQASCSAFSSGGLIFPDHLKSCACQRNPGLQSSVCWLSLSLCVCCPPIWHLSCALPVTEALAYVHHLSRSVQTGRPPCCLRRKAFMKVLGCLWALGKGQSWQGQLQEHLLGTGCFYRAGAAAAVPWGAVPPWSVPYLPPPLLLSIHVCGEDV